MVVLLCYGLIIHILSFIVLYVKYNIFRGKLAPLEHPLPVRQPSKTTSSTATNGVSKIPPVARVGANPVPRESDSAIDEVEC